MLGVVNHAVSRAEFARPFGGELFRGDDVKPMGLIFFAAQVWLPWCAAPVATIALCRHGSARGFHPKAAISPLIAASAVTRLS
jgi:hypothetical protein